MKKIHGFTLAEVLITLGIIGVVAAATIPSIIANTQQSEFATGLSKAVSALNQAISLNVALTGETPYDNANLFRYLTSSMSIIKSTDSLKYGDQDNFAFYTTDGMRIEIPYDEGTFLDLYEDNSTQAYANNGGCGSLGLDKNPYNTKYPPCIIMVDVNGDRKPNPANANLEGVPYKYAMPNDKLVKDVFTILISDIGARPYGVIGQKTMYKARKN